MQKSASHRYFVHLPIVGMWTEKTRHSWSNPLLGRGQRLDFSTDAVAILADDGDVNLISAPVFTSSMNLPINIAEKFDRRSLRNLCWRDIWINPATIWAKKCVCETWKILGRVSVCQLPGYTLSRANHGPLSESRPREPPWVLRPDLEYLRIQCSSSSHWGCFSQELFGSVRSGRCWFVYQIHPPAIDTLVTRTGQAGYGAIDDDE